MRPASGSKRLTEFMKIGLFTESYLPDPNGIATSVAATAAEFEKMGHTVYIIAPKHPHYKDRKNVIRLYSMRMYEKLDMRTALHLPERNLIKILRLDLDIVHGHGGGSVSLLGWEVARLKNIPFVGTYHTLAHEYAHYLLRGKVLTPRILKAATKIFGNMSEQIIAPTVRAKEELRKLGVKSPITILPNGIDRNVFENAKKGFLRSKLNVKPDTKILLYVGRLGREKSVEFLIKSYAHIIRAHTSTQLVLVGDGPDKKALKALAVKLKIGKNVHFAGFIKRDQIPSVYKDADIFVFASKTETQGMAPIEAMTAGLPIVAVNDRAFEELIQNGANGFLTRRTEADFSLHVSKLLDSEEKIATMSKNAVSSTEKYSLAHHAKQLEKLYADLILAHKTRKTSPIRKTFRGAKRLIRLLTE